MLTAFFKEVSSVTSIIFGYKQLFGIPIQFALATYNNEATKLLQDLQSRNERMFLLTFIVLNVADTKQKLDNNVFQASSIAQKYNCQLVRLDFRQEQGLMSSLPLAYNQIEIQRGLTTSSVAIFIPFTTQELFQTSKEALYAVLNLRDENGKRIKKWIPTGLDVKNNKRKAEAFLQEKIREYEGLQNTQTETACIKKEPENKTYNPPAKRVVLSATPFVDVVNDWLADKKAADTLDKATFQFYESLCNNHIIPYFKKRKYNVEEITTEILQAFIDYEEKHGNSKDKKKPLSPRSLKHLRIILNQSIKFAIKSRIIDFNPCAFVKLPKQQKKIVNFYNEAQLKTLFENIKSEELYPLIYVTVVYGLRRSEVLGLKWDSVDFINKTVTIKHTVTRFSEVIEKDSTKTNSSYRTYPLPPEIEEIFRKQKSRERRGIILYGDEYHHNEYIFKWDYGKPYAPDFITRKFNRMLVNNELPVIRFHDLRHSCASLLLSKGFTLKDIQEWLGHSDIEVTANIYTHLDQERKKNIMSSITI